MQQVTGEGVGVVLPVKSRQETFTAIHLEVPRRGG